MKTNITTTSKVADFNESDVRDYAYHLYLQSGSVPGRDLDNWLEAEACLRGSIPMEKSHARLQSAVQKLTGRTKRSPSAELLQDLA